MSIILIIFRLLFIKYILIMSDGSKVLLGVLAGAAAGVLTGLLIAPTSGKETRDKITSKSEELLEAVKDLIEKEKETLKNVGKAKKEAEK